ncbi:MAG: SDR family NAD(P)-dependent oxidoreductase [Mesonia hippocampi]|uniref:SDR family NAD(P)-dependent oxidoreductase n=1 Tax=Mesonia hippocampi TaxID=1628250 RepID=UPI003F9DF25A
MRRKKVLLIVGAGSRVGFAAAKKFINEGFKVLLLSRNQGNLNILKGELLKYGDDVVAYVADVSDETNLNQTLDIISKNHKIDVLLYNVARIVQKDILEEASGDLQLDYHANVIGLQLLVKGLLKNLTETKGTILVTGGGIALHPKPAYASLSMTSAALRSMVNCLENSLKPKNIFIALLMVNHRISEDSSLHHPDKIANTFWGLYNDKSVLEVLM